MSENENPFATEPESTGGKMLFGSYRLIGNRVDFEAGASYTDPRYTDKDGNVWQFKGKKKSKTGKNTHVIQDLTCEAQDGHEYVTFRDWMWFSKDVCRKAVIDSHKKFFGEKLEGIFGKVVEAQLEEVEVQDGSYTRKCFKVVAVFKSKKERNAAREAHFAKFKQNGNGESSFPGNEAPKFDAATVALINKNAKGRTPEQIIDYCIDESVVTAMGGKEATIEAIKEVLS